MPVFEVAVQSKAWKTHVSCSLNCVKGALELRLKSLNLKGSYRVQGLGVYTLKGVNIGFRGWGSKLLQGDYIGEYNTGYGVWTMAHIVVEEETPSAAADPSKP